MTAATLQSFVQFVSLPRPRRSEAGGGVGLIPTRLFC